MPRLSRTGRVVAGVAGIPGSIDGTLISSLINQPALGGWQWLTDAVAIGQVCDVSCSLWTSAGQQIDGLGLNAIAAGGGRWAAHLFNGGMPQVRSNFGLSESNQFVLGGAPNGDIAVLRDYSQGFGFNVHRSSGEVQSFDIPWTGYPISIRNGLFAFPQTGVGWRIWDLDARREVNYQERPDTNLLTVARALDGRIVLFERDSQGGLRVRLSTVWDGVQILPGPTESSNGPDVIVLGSTVRMVWATTEGEAVGDIVTHDLPLSQLGDAIVIPPDPVPPTDPLPVEVSGPVTVTTTIDGPPNNQTRIAIAAAGVVLLYLLVRE